MIELMAFELRPGVDDATFMAADRRVQTEFAYHQPGLVRRTTAHNDAGHWIVLDLWRSEADADACAARWEVDPIPAAFMALVDERSVRSQRYQTLD